MAKRITTAEFIERAKAIHGDRYDYSRVRYVTNRIEVTITCEKHGDFKQRPKYHLRGGGCPDCKKLEIGDSRRLSLDDFIAKAKAIHGDRYDYSQVEYVDYHTKVTIICRDHGPFEQKPTNHLSGCGCAECGGRKQLTTETFIAKAKAVHGDRYDYAQIEYVTAHTKVTIICSKHGPFEQTPASHNTGRGCPNCSHLLTTDEFIAKAKAVHGDRYDYSEADYVNSASKITIICSDHGAFRQRASGHLTGYGCFDCASQKHTNESFIAKAKAIHGDCYDYSLVEYVHAHSKITIVCPDHGPFEQKPNGHLGGQGCAVCSGNVTLTREQFIASAEAVHGDRYDYSPVEYANTDTKVTIVCPDHGSFTPTPHNHIRGAGCPECANIATGDATRKTAEQFIADARAKHGDRFDYSQVEYVDSRSKITIGCDFHGPFQQEANSHLQGIGCPACAETGFNPNEPGVLYYIAVTTDDGDTRYKIGITNLTVEERFVRKADFDRIRTVKTWQFAVGRIAAEREAEILYQYAGDRYYGPNILVGAGNSELFTHDVLGLDRRDDEHGQSAVDADASLTSRQIQSDFDF